MTSDLIILQLEDYRVVSFFHVRSALSLLPYSRERVCQNGSRSDAGLVLRYIPLCCARAINTPRDAARHIPLSLPYRPQNLFIFFLALSQRPRITNLDS